MERPRSNDMVQERVVGWGRGCSPGSGGRFSARVCPALVSTGRTLPASKAAPSLLRSTSLTGPNSTSHLSDKFWRQSRPSCCTTPLPPRRELQSVMGTAANAGSGFGNWASDPASPRSRRPATGQPPAGSDHRPRRRGFRHRAGSEGPSGAFEVRYLRWSHVPPQPSRPSGPFVGETSDSPSGSLGSSFIIPRGAVGGRAESCPSLLLFLHFGRREESECEPRATSHEQEASSSRRCPFLPPWRVSTVSTVSTVSVPVAASSYRRQKPKSELQSLHFSLCCACSCFCLADTHTTCLNSPESPNHPNHPNPPPSKMPVAVGTPQTLYDKVLQAHVVDQKLDGTILLYIGRFCALGLLVLSGHF